MTLPTFQPQNPALSHYSLGWSSCTAFSAAMVASYDRQVGKLVSGAQVRGWTGDTVGGTTLAQNDDALRTHTPVDLDTRYRLPWDEFVRRIRAGEGAILQGWYDSIARTRFDAGGGFKGNHAIAVFPGFIVMDPLADGTRSGIYKYHGESYPEALLRDFAGKLNIGSGRVVPLGTGLVYAAFSRAIAAPTAPPPVAVQRKALLPSYDFFIYDVDWIHRFVSPSTPGRHREHNPNAGSVPVDRAQLIKWAGHSSRSLLRVEKGIYAGKGIDSQYEVTK